MKPARLKFRKSHRWWGLNKTASTEELQKGNLGLIALQSTTLTAKLLETIKGLAKKGMLTIKGQKKFSKLRIYPDLPITKKSLGTRMGSGKGIVDFYVGRCRKNQVIIELGVENCTPKDNRLLLNILKKISYKLPIKTKIISNNINEQERQLEVEL